MPWWQPAYPFPEHHGQATLSIPDRSSRIGMIGCGVVVSELRISESRYVLLRDGAGWGAWLIRLFWAKDYLQSLWIDLICRCWLASLQIPHWNSSLYLLPVWSNFAWGDASSPSQRWPSLHSPDSVLWRDPAIWSYEMSICCRSSFEHCGF